MKIGLEGGYIRLQVMGKNNHIVKIRIILARELKRRLTNIAATAELSQKDTCR